MSTHSPTPDDADSPASDVAGRPVVTHLRCSSCGYDLHGLAQDGRCPECGLEVAETVAPSRFEREWLLTIRYGVRWMIASMYVFAFLVVTSYMQSTENALVAVMQFAGAVALMKRNPNRPDDAAIVPWPQWLLAASVPAYLVASTGWVIALDMQWILYLLGAGLQAAALVMLWLRLASIARHGIAPKIPLIARSLAWLTVAVGVLTPLPLILWRTNTGSQQMYSIAEGLRLLWLVLLLVWFLASTVTLHLMMVPLQRIIHAIEDASASDEPARAGAEPVHSGRSAQ